MWNGQTISGMGLACLRGLGFSDHRDRKHVFQRDVGVMDEGNDQTAASEMESGIRGESYRVCADPLHHLHCCSRGPARHRRQDEQHVVFREQRLHPVVFELFAGWQPATLSRGTTLVPKHA